MPPAKPTAPRSSPPSRQISPQPPPEVVDPIWLLKAIALTVVAALVCAWLTACWLVYQGEWQLVLHPEPHRRPDPGQPGLAFDEIRFGASETGQPRLTGGGPSPKPPHPTPNPAPSLPIPIPIPKYAAYTILYLHDGSGSLSNTVPMLARLHRAGLNVFAFDYRGFGTSDASAHPSEARMAQDAAAALDYLTATRHIPTRTSFPTESAWAQRSPPISPTTTPTYLPSSRQSRPRPRSTAASAHPPGSSR